jgi:hypothetical protein
MSIPHRHSYTAVAGLLGHEGQIDIAFYHQRYTRMPQKMRENLSVDARHLCSLSYYILDAFYVDPFYVLR